MYSLNIESNAHVVAITGNVNMLVDEKLISLQVGNNIVTSDVLIIDVDSTITLQYSDGSVVTYNQENVAIQDDAKSSDDDASTVKLTKPSIEDEISAIQKSITDDDGDLELPATASGGDSSQGGISFVSLDREANELAIDSEFSSGGLLTSTDQTVDNQIFDSSNQQVNIADSEISFSQIIDHQNKIISISGNVTNNSANTIITLVIEDINGVKVTVNNVIADALGNYTIPIVDISSLGDGELNIQVSIVDGNNQLVNVSETVVFDSTPPLAPTFTINDGFDGIINSIEKNEGIDVTIDLSQPDISVGDEITIIFGSGDTATRCLSN